MKKLDFADWLGMGFIVIMIIVFLLIPAPAKADWGKTGHRIVGEVAERQLTEDVKKVIYDILDGESLATVDAIAMEEVSSLGFFGRAWSNIRLLTYRFLIEE